MTHDYTAKTISVKSLNSTHVLVGESGGLSAVYGVEKSYVMPGCVAVETEHGTLYMDAEDDFVTVLDEVVA